MKTLKALLFLVPVLLAGAVRAADNCTEMLRSDDDVLVDRYTERATETFVFPRFIGDKELCRIAKYDGPFGNDKYCFDFFGNAAYTVVRHGDMTCNSSTCERPITFIRDGLSCGPFVWGPDHGEDDDARFKVGAYYKPVTRVTVTVQTLGLGSATIDGQAVSSKAVLPGQDVVIEAFEQPGSGYRFSHWEWYYGFGYLSLGSDKRRVFSTTTGGTYRAVFVQVIHKLTVVAAANGTTNPPSGTVVNVPYGSAISPAPRATGNAGWTFNKWVVTQGLGNIQITNPNNMDLNGTMTGDATVTAVFTANLRTVYLTATEGGYVIPQNQNQWQMFIWHPIQAVPSTGWEFAGWTACPSGSPNLTIENPSAALTRFHVTDGNLVCGSDGAPTITANFRRKKVRLTVLADPGGYTDPSGTIEVDAGISTTVHGMSHDGFRFNQWKIESGSVTMETGWPTSYPTLTSDATIRATYHTLYPIYLRAEGGGWIYQPSPMYKAVDEDFLFHAIENPGYMFKGWSSTMGQVHMDNPEESGVRGRLLTPEAAELVAYFVPLAWNVSGTLTNSVTTTGIQGVSVKFKAADGSEMSAVTGSDGRFYLGQLLAGTYTVTTTHPCFGVRTETVQITGDYQYDRSLSRQISMNASKRKVQVNEITDLSVSSCPEAVEYIWYTDLGGAEEKSHQGRDISVSFANTGFKTVRAVVRYVDGQQVTQTNSGYIEVVPCLPGRPTLKVSAEAKASSGKVVDRCPDGLGRENVAFTADLELGACPPAGTTTYAWTLNGTGAGTASAVTLAIIATPKVQKVRATATRSGKSYTGGMDLELVECALDNKGRPPLSRNEILLSNKIVNGTTITLVPIPSTTLRDDDGRATVIGDAVFEPACGTCKHEITFQKWVLSWTDDFGKKFSREYTTEGADIVLDQGFRDYTLVAHGTTRDLQKNTVLKPVQTSRLIQLMPQIPLPNLGTCANAPFYCQAFYSDALTGTAIDPRKTTATIASKGLGFSGPRDDGAFSYQAGDGDFTLSARINSLPGGEAGVMIRNSLLVGDRSLFLGRRGGDVVIIHRERFSNDAIPLNITVADPCLRIKRTGGVVTLHTANTNPCPNPATDPGWTDRMAGLSLDLSLWQGRVLMGLAAGGASANVAFDNVSVRAGEALALPSMNVNTLFADGNLVSNWSFESPWDAFTKAGSINLHVEENGANTAYTGRFFARVTGKAAGQEVATRDPMLLRVTNLGQQAIGLHIKYRYRLNAAATVNPALVFSTKDGVASSPMLLGALTPPSYNVWHQNEHYVYYRDVPSFSTYEYFRFHLSERNNVLSTSQTADFDDVQITPILPNVPNRSKPVTTVAFADGMTQEFQTVKLGETEDIVSARLLDEEGRAMRTLPVFGGKKSLNPAEFNDVRKDAVASAQQYYDDLTPDPRRRVGDMVIDFKPKWNDFREDAGKVIVEPSPLNRSMATYGRSGAKDQDMAYTYGTTTDKSQSIKTTVMGGTDRSRSVNEYQNAYGYAVKTESFGSDPLDAPLITSQEKDILGRVWASTTPEGLRRTNVYNTVDHPVATSDPDAGSTQSIYDKRGLLRFFQDRQKVSDGIFIANVYDKLGRLTHVFLVRDPSSFTQELADLPDWPKGNPNAELQVQTVYDVIPTDLPSEIGASALTNLKGKASASYATTARGKVATYFSYDERGQLKTEWKQILHLPIQRSDIIYNLAGKMVRKQISGTRPNGVTYSKVEEVAYDEFNRIKHIRDGSALPGANDIARFEYWPDGKVRYLDYGSTLNQGLAYQYDESERLVRMQHEVIQTQSENPGVPMFYPSSVYEQRLKYDESGNVASQNYRVGFMFEPFRGVKYTYDPYNRLQDADYGKSNTSYDAIDYAASNELNSNFLYNDDGAITHAVRGKANVSTGADYGQYHYYPGTHRLRRIDGTVVPFGKDRSHADNYLYDANGNVILDRGTKRLFTYDYRNLPVKVVYCETLTGDSCSEIREILEMVYDAEGHRVAKFTTR